MRPLKSYNESFLSQDKEMKSADGQTVDLDSMSPEDLHFRFGESWRVEMKDSKFRYSRGESYATYYQPQFRPVFEMPAESSPLAMKLCGDNKVVWDHSNIT
jgi:hypothetical protein